MEEAQLKSFYLRKLLHLFTGGLFLFFFYLGFLTLGMKSTLMFATGILVFIAVIEFLRLDYGFFNFVNSVVKPKEENHLSAITYSLVTGIVVFSIFDMNIAFAAMSVSIFGDVSAAIFGQLLGKHKIGTTKDKTLEGFVAYFIVGLLVCTAFLPFYHSVVLVLIASLVELHCSKVEDNFLIPLIVSFVAYIMSLI